MLPMDIGVSASLANSSSASLNSPMQLTGGGKNKTSPALLLTIAGAAVGLGLLLWYLLKKK